MGNFGSAAMALTMFAAGLLLFFGIKQVRAPETRQRGLLMIACAIVFVSNVLIWTL